jgi:hypothetical protein
VAEVGEIDGVVFLAGLATLLKAQDWDTEQGGADVRREPDRARRGSSGG